MKKILLILILLFWVGMASAETGYLNASAGAGNSYAADGGTGSALSGVTWADFNFDIANYNRITTLNITLTTGFTFSKASDAGTFTVVEGAGNSGSGTWSFDSTTKVLHYNFYNTVVAASPLRLTLSKAISVAPTNMAQFFEAGCDAVSSTKPIVLVDDGLTGMCTNAGISAWSYIAQTQKTFSNYYTVTYSLGSVFINVDKSSTSIQTKISVLNLTTLKYIEPTFNTLTFDYGYVYDNGLVLKMEDSSGNYDQVTVNTTSCSLGVCTGAPTPTPTPIIDPLTHAGILWNHDNYTLNDIATIQYLIESSILNFAYNFNIRIYDNSGTEVNRFDNLDVSTLSGSVQYQLNSVGNYRAEFYQSLCVLGICADTLLDTKSVSVNLYPSYITINSPVIAGKSFNASYIFGNAVLAQGELNSVVIQKLTNGQLLPFSTTSLGNNNINVSTSYNISLIVDSKGSYTATLFDISRGNIATTQFNAVEGFIPPTNNLSTSFIKTDKDSYLLDDEIIVSYGLDNTNYSNGSLSKYVAFYNYDNNVYDIIFSNGIAIPIYSQLDIFKTPIMASATCTGSDIQCYESTTRNFLTGNTGVQLRAKTSTGTDILLAEHNITINKVDSSGYGLVIGKTQLCLNEETSISVYSPTDGQLFIWITNSYGGRTLIKGYSFNTNKTVKFQSSTAGNYPIELLDSNGSTYQENWINVKSSCDAFPTPTPTPIHTIGGGGESASEITSMLTSNLFWALIFSVGLMGFIAYKTRDGLPTAISGMTSLGVFTWMAWVPPAIFYSVLIIAAAVYLAPGIAAKFFNIGSGK